MPSASLNVQLNRRLQGVPRDKRSIIFRAVEQVLMNDPILATVVQTWRSYRGNSPEDTAPPTADMCPWIRLSMVPRQNMYVAESLQKIPMAIQIESATAGTCQDDSMDLWGAIENAVQGTKPSVGGQIVAHYLRSCVIDPATGGPAGVYDFRFESSGFFQGRVIDPQTGRLGPVTFMIGTGVFLLWTVKPA